MYKGQIICCFIILFLLVFYFLVNHEKTKSSKWFSVLLVTSFVQLLFDIFSVYTVNHLYTVSKILNRIVHCFYMGFLLCIFYVAYKYLEAVIEEEIGERFVSLKYSVWPLVLTCIGVCVLPLSYMETAKGNYSYGPAANMVFIGVGIYLILITRIMINHRNDIPLKKKRAFIIALFSELVVAIYQGVFVPTSLITCLGITLLNLGIYITVENPDAMLVELLKKETKRADVANQAKTNFLANMSHEIRTPINAVLGMNEMILRESNEKNVIEYARDIDGAAKSLLSIINDILDITKIEAGKLTIILGEYNFSNMIFDVVNMISFKAKAKNLEFQENIDEKIPGRLLGDDIRIRQILVNLLNNAVKYTHVGMITLEVRLLPYEQEDVARIYFSVKDTGIGIKEEDIPKLYVPFERVEEKRNRNIEGTGLGMSITTQLLSMLDSELTIKSEYGKGSEFSFVLNQKIIGYEPIGKLEKRVESDNISDYHISYEAPEAKILVVDDNELNRRVFKNLLKGTKIQIEEASSGRECIEKAKEIMFDIIFMDHMMPEMDGIETFKTLKLMEDCINKETPVVILTANAIVGAKEQYLNEGFEGFISKPINYNELEMAVEKLLDKKMIHYIEMNDDNQSKEVSQDLSEIPFVDGLDWGYAATHFKDIESMLDTVKFFISTIEYDAKELENNLLMIYNEDGMKNYCTKVHSMKNSAGVIGIIPLAGMAKVLEDAARNYESDLIIQLTPVFLKCWRGYKEHLKVFEDTNSVKKEAAACVEEINELYSVIRSAAGDMDVDMMDEALKKLEEYFFEGEQADFFDNIKRAVINLDVEFLQNIY